jgi:hypothetical protein
MGGWFGGVGGAPYWGFGGGGGREGFGYAALYSRDFGAVPQESDLTPEELRAAGIRELKKRIHERPDCAKLFGGEKKALKDFDKIKFSFGTLSNNAVAETVGKNVTIDPSRYTEDGAILAISQDIRDSNVGGHKSTTWKQMTISISGTTFAAFVLFHEFGHVSKVYEKRFDNDGGVGNTFGFYLEQGANNEKIRAACFSELKPIAQ